MSMLEADDGEALYLQLKEEMRAAIRDALAEYDAVAEFRAALAATE